MTAAATPSHRPDPRLALALARRPWSLDTEGGDLVVRGATPADLAAVAGLHARCSADTLLQRYLRGGRAPSLSLTGELLRRPLVVVAHDRGGLVRAMACGSRPAVVPGRPPEPTQTLQVAVVVEDAWQRRGVGTALMTHLAATAVLLGYRELVADAVAQGLPLRRVLDAIGPTRAARVDGVHRLRTQVGAGTASGLGPVTLAI